MTDVLLPRIGTSANKHVWAFDAQNRLTEYADTGAGVLVPADITYRYDANGNIREMKSTYDTLSSNGTVAAAASPQDYWYTYDGLNRFLVTMGTLSGTTIVDGTIGTTVTYDTFGNRATTTDTADGTETYHYDNASNLTSVTAGASTLATYTYDQLNRVKSTFEYNASGANVYSRTGIVYDKDGHVTADATSTTNGTTHNTQSSTYTVDARGLVTAVSGTATSTPSGGCPFRKPHFITFRP